MTYEIKATCERSVFTETRAYMLTQLFRMVGAFNKFAKFGHQVPKILPAPVYPSHFQLFLQGKTIAVQYTEES